MENLILTTNVVLAVTNQENIYVQALVLKLTDAFFINSVTLRQNRWQLSYVRLRANFAPSGAKKIKVAFRKFLRIGLLQENSGSYLNFTIVMVTKMAEK